MWSYREKLEPVVLDLSHTQVPMDPQFSHLRSTDNHANIGTLENFKSINMLNMLMCHCWYHFHHEIDSWESSETYCIPTPRDTECLHF